MFGAIRDDNTQSEINVNATKQAWLTRKPSGLDWVRTTSRKNDSLTLGALLSLVEEAYNRNP